MYNLTGYGSMIADRIRVNAYAQALRKIVREGSVVVEIGTGPGIFAVLACQVGARRVYAIESGEIIQVAREVASANGCADKIEFFEKFSNEVSLPERADVIVSDLRGVLPPFEHHIPSITDARHRFLAPNGSLVPRKDTIWAAVLECPEIYNEFVGPWEHNSLGQDLSTARQLVVNNSRRVRVKPEQLLTKPRLWATVDYATVESPDIRSTLDWVVEQAGTGHGILVWFDADLAEDIGFSNAPSAPETIYGSLFFPWTGPVSLVAGQTVKVTLDANLVEKDYVWRWTTHIEPPDRSGGSLIHFEQSHLTGEILSAAQLHRIAANYVPRLSTDGQLCRRVFELMDGTASLEEIAHRLATEFTGRFPRWEQALAYVGGISQEYSR
jgi:type I protein arginine methyltransferase